MFILTLFTIAKIRRQPECPSVDEWTKKMWYIHTIEFCSALRRKEVLTHATTRINLENMLSEVSQSQKDKYHRVLLIRGT